MVILPAAQPRSLRITADGPRKKLKPARSVKIILRQIIFWKKALVMISKIYLPGIFLPIIGLGKDFQRLAEQFRASGETSNMVIKNLPEPLKIKHSASLKKLEI